MPPRSMTLYSVVLKNYNLSRQRVGRTTFVHSAGKLKIIVPHAQQEHTVYSISFHEFQGNKASFSFYDISKSNTELGILRSKICSQDSDNLKGGQHVNCYRLVAKRESPTPAPPSRSMMNQGGPGVRVRVHVASSCTCMFICTCVIILCTHTSPRYAPPVLLFSL